MKRTITGKILRGILLINGIVLLLACTLFFFYEYRAFRKAKIDELFSISRILGANASAALAFRDPVAAEEILGALQRSPDISGAGLYDEKGKLFATYPANSDQFFPAIPGEPGFQLNNKAIEGFQPVLLEGKKVGTLYLHGNLDALYDRMVVYGMLSLVVLVLSSFVTYVLYKMLKRKMLREVELQTSELRQSQATILAFTHELEQRVTERTAQLEVVNHELESFSYSVSHDLRAPLRSIHGYLNILHEEYVDKLDPEGQRILNVVLKSAHRMGQLIDDLLAFSKLGRRELTRSEIRMEEMVRLLCDEQKNTGTTATFTINPLPPAQGDHAMIRQVWTNLISNAVKYSFKVPEPAIEIGAKEQDNTTIYYIKDNGAGFDMQYYDKLFGVFQRLHSAKDFEGTGVGLAIVQRVIAKHGGRIWAEGTPGKGASFFFSLSPHYPSNTLEKPQQEPV